MKARDFLVKNGLAKPGRGRYSLQAKQYLAEAIANGQTFSDFYINPEDIANPAKKSASRTATILTKSFRKRIRNEDIQWGVDLATKPGQSNIPIAFSSCYACSRSVGYCACSDGPTLPKWLGGSQGRMTKP